MRVEVKVIPKSSRSLVKEEEGRLKVYITAAPEKGKANKALIDLLASYFSVKKKDVRIIRNTPPCRNGVCNNSIHQSRQQFSRSRKCRQERFLLSAGRRRDGRRGQGVGCRQDCHHGRGAHTQGRQDIGGGVAVDVGVDPQSSSIAYPADFCVSSLGTRRLL